MIVLVHYRLSYQAKCKGEGDVFPFRSLWCGTQQRHQSIDLLRAHWQQSPRLSKRPLRGLEQSLSEVKRFAWQNKSGCTPCRFGQPRIEYDGINSGPHSGTAYCAAWCRWSPWGQVVAGEKRDYRVPKHARTMNGPVSCRIGCRRFPTISLEPITRIAKPYSSYVDRTLAGLPPAYNLAHSSLLPICTLPKMGAFYGHETPQYLLGRVVE